MKRLFLFCLSFALVLSMPAMAESYYYSVSGTVVGSSDQPAGANRLQMVVLRDSRNNYSYLINVKPAYSSSFERMMNASMLDTLPTANQATQQLGLNCTTPINVATATFYYVTDGTTLTNTGANCLIGYYESYSSAY